MAVPLSDQAVWELVKQAKQAFLQTYSHCSEEEREALWSLSSAAEHISCVQPAPYVPRSMMQSAPVSVQAESSVSLLETYNASPLNLVFGSRFHLEILSTGDQSPLLTPLLRHRQCCEAIPPTRLPA